MCACSPLLRSSDVSFSLKEKVLTWDVDHQGRVYVFVYLFSSLGIFNRHSSLLEEKVRS